MPLGRLALVAQGLEDAGTRLDASAGPAARGRADGPGGPGDLGDLGAAGVVVATALAAATDAAARIVAETHVLGTAVRLTGEDYSRTDAEAVVAQFEVPPSDLPPAEAGW